VGRHYAPELLTCEHGLVRTLADASSMCLGNGVVEPSGPAFANSSHGGHVLVRLVRVSWLEVYLTLCVCCDSVTC
jgi:hypothetical protein